MWGLWTSRSEISSPSGCSSCSRACSAPTTRWSWPSWSWGCRRGSTRRRCATASSAASPSASSPRCWRPISSRSAGCGWRAASTCCTSPTATSSRTSTARAGAAGAEGEGHAGTVAVLGHGGSRRGDQPGVLDRLDPRRGGDVAQAVGGDRRRHHGHRRHAARGRPADRPGAALSGARGRRVHHHRVGGVQAVLGVPPRCRIRAPGDSAVVLADAHRPHLRRVLCLRAGAGPVETSPAGEDAEHILEGEAEAIAASDGTVEK